MQKHRKALAFGGCAALVGILPTFSFRSEPEPTYTDNPISYWVREAWLGGRQEQRALQAIGTNAFPFLLRWFEKPEPAYRRFGFLPPPQLRPGPHPSGSLAF